jgi:hypothetical protein
MIIFVPNQGVKVGHPRWLKSPNANISLFRKAGAAEMAYMHQICVKKNGLWATQMSYL